jgi:hypothetical protein
LKSNRPKLSAPQKRGPRLCVESLDDRDCPSLIYLNASLEYTGERNVVLWGGVSDEWQTTSTIYFSGAVQGQTTTGSGGMFLLHATASGLGDIQAYAVNSLGYSSDTETLQVSSEAPNATSWVTYGEGREVTISGSIGDEHPQSTTVTLSGPVTGSVTPDEWGNYSYTATASGLGTVSIAVTDAWSLSGSDSVLLAVDPPEITYFEPTQESGVWAFVGYMYGPNPSQATYTLTGLPSLSGISGSVDSDGVAARSVALGPTESGTVTLTITDAWGQSDTATYFVSQG